MPKVTQETIAEAESFHRQPPSPPAWPPPIRSSACGGAHIPPPSIHQPVCLGVYAGATEYLSPASAPRTEAERSLRAQPAPHARSRQTALPVPAPLQPVRGSRRGKGAAAGRRPGSAARLALCALRKPRRGEPLSRMKKLQGAHLRKVGQEGGGAAEGGWQKPAPIKSSLRWGRSGKRPGGNTQGMLRGSRQ